MGAVRSLSSQEVRHVGENVDKPDPEQEEGLMVRKLINWGSALTQQPGDQQAIVVFVPAEDEAGSGEV